MHTDLAQFHRFLSEKVSNGGSLLSPEEVLDEWRKLNPQPFSEEEEIAAIQEAIDDIDNGDAGVPWTDFDQEFRQEKNLRPNP